VLSALQEPLFEHIRYIIHDHQAAQDILQETLLIVARAIGQVRDPRLVVAWAMRIANRAALTHQRKAARGAETVPLTGDEADPRTDIPAERLFDPVVHERLHALLPRLPVGCGTVVRLRYLEEFTLLEVAEALELPLGTVKSRLHYGLSLLRGQLSASE